MLSHLQSFVAVFVVFAAHGSLSALGFDISLDDNVCSVTDRLRLASDCLF